MWKHEVEEFADYEVYEIVEGKVHILCACKEYDVARTIACMLAMNDKQGDSYYVTSINHPGDLVPGGGWYDSWRKNSEGKLVRSSLS